MGISVQEQLLGHLLRNEVESFQSFRSQVFKNMFFGLSCSEMLESEQIIDLRNENMDFGDELDDSLRDQEDSVVFASRVPLGDDVTEDICDLGQSLFLSLNFFTNQGVVGSCLELTL